MPGFALTVPDRGDVLYGDGQAIVADTVEEARALWEHETGDRLLYMHSHIGICRVVSAGDVENGDCHEDAEPGDTTVDYCRDDGRDLSPGEIRVWEPGAPSLCDWRGVPVHGCSVADIPVGTQVGHRRLGDAVLVAPAYRDPRMPNTYAVLLRFGDRELVCLSSRLYLVPTINNWRPPPTMRFEVDGELVATTRSDWAFEALRSMRETRLRNEWEARHFAEAEASATRATDR